jgi:hypothetical protein
VSATSAPPRTEFEPERVGDFRLTLCTDVPMKPRTTLPLSRSCGKSLFYRIRRDGKTNTDVAAGLAKDRRIDANHFTAQIDQRPPELPG